MRDLVILGEHQEQRLFPVHRHVRCLAQIGRVRSGADAVFERFEELVYLFGDLIQFLVVVQRLAVRIEKLRYALLQVLLFGKRWFAFEILFKTCAQVDNFVLSKKRMKFLIYPIGSNQTKNALSTNLVLFTPIRVWQRRFVNALGDRVLLFSISCLGLFDLL